MTSTDAAQPAWILPLTAEGASLPLVGGKGANLARLARAGFPVPDGFLVTTHAYQAFVAANGLSEPIRDALAASPLDTAELIEVVADHIQALFRQGRLPPDLAAALLAAYARLAAPPHPEASGQQPPCPVAVRSSATAEDLPEMSFAGQQDTYLNVIGPDALLRAVVDCWSSLWTPRAISYRTRNRVPHAEVSLAVVVQRMVQSEASGVLFTANPLTGLRSEIVIDATVGLGEALVAGQVEPDHYVVDAATGQITERRIGAKALSVRARPGGGTVTVAENRGGGVAPPVATPGRTESWASRSGIEASAGLSGSRTPPAKASTPEDHLNIYSAEERRGEVSSPIATPGQTKSWASRSGIEASAGLSGSRTPPAKASTPEDHLNIYSAEERRGGVSSPLQALPDRHILALAALGQQVADLYAAPQDIEWAWADDTLYLLQTRPITSLFPVPAGAPADPLLVFLSFGAVQGMLEPITPAGRDIMVRVMAAGARIFGMAVTPETQRALFVAGERLWINVTPLLRNAIGRRALPGITSFVDPAAGENLAAIWGDPRLQPGRAKISGHAALALARFLLPVAGNVLLNLLAPHRRRRLIVGRGERLLAATEARCAARQGPPRARLAQTAQIIADVMARHVPGAFRLFVSGVASGMAAFNLVRVLTRHLPGVSPDHILEITRGLPNNPTTEMDLALWGVAQAIHRDGASRDAFNNRPASALAAAYQARALPPAAQQSIERFMVRYGSRGLAEIDIGRPRWREEPAHVMELLAGYLEIARAAQSAAPDAVFARGAAHAAAVVDELAAAARPARFGWLRARLVRFAAGRARALMGLRESPKFFAVRMFGLFRAALLEAGQELVAAGELQGADDLFYLSLAELSAFAAGEPAAWAELIAGRREAYRREGLRRQIPRLLLSDGRTFYAGLTAAGATADTLMGSPVSPGSVTGRVRVVRDPRQAGLQPGEILVCPGTDPSWTPLFLTAAGLIMEVGGLMTHGAVVAREYGIPAVVGVDRATERLRTGQIITLDGATGVITLVAEAT